MRRVLGMIFALALLLGLAACATVGKTTVTVYLLCPTDAAQPVGSAQAELRPGRTAVETAVMGLIHPPQNSDGLYSPFPSGVRLEGVEQEGGTVTLHLSGEYLALEGVALAEAEGCTALTLCGLDGVTGVRIMVDGAPHPLGRQGVLTADGVVTEEIGSASLEREITIYFPSEETGRLEPERRQVVLREGEAVEGYVIEELMKGPTQKGLVSPLPGDLELRDVAVEGEICSLSFSREFEELTKGSVSDELTALVSIANSVVASSPASGVRFLVEGEPLYGGTLLGECPELADPYSYTARTVWLPSHDGDFVEPVSVMLPADGGKTTDRLLVEYLIGGPDGSGFYSPLPRGVKINAMVCTSTYCHIDFSAELVENITDERAQRMALMSVANTLFYNGYARYGVEISVESEFIAQVTANADDIHPDFR